MNILMSLGNGSSMNSDALTWFAECNFRFFQHDVDDDKNPAGVLKYSFKGIIVADWRLKISIRAIKL